jgi:hypothetical protein
MPDEIYVYRSYPIYLLNIIKLKIDNLIQTSQEDITEDKFIENIVRKLLSSTDRVIFAYCDTLKLRIVASKTPIQVKDTKIIVPEEKNGESVDVEKELEFLGKYVMKDGDVVKNAFKPRKLKKPSRAKVSKSAQKRRKSKSKSKNKSKKRSPKPRRH